MELNWATGIDWYEVFMPGVPILEIFVRASLLYLGLFLLLRCFLRRQLGALGTTDLLVVVLIASTANNAMGTIHKSISDGLIMAITMIFWNLVFQYISQHNAFFARLLHPPAICLVKNGRFDRKAMDRELITEEEIRMQMREQGIGSMQKVKLICLEADGRISIITHDSKRHPKPKKVKV